MDWKTMLAYIRADKSGTRTGLLPREAWRASEILLPEGWRSFLTRDNEVFRLLKM